jgi:hypothetical protein
MGGATVQYIASRITGGVEAGGVSRTGEPRVSGGRIDEVGDVGNFPALVGGTRPGASSRDKITHYREKLLDRFQARSSLLPQPPRQVPAELTTMPLHTRS